MADFRPLKSMAWDDEDQFDWLRRMGQVGPHMDAPDYPPGLCFTVREADFERLGVDVCNPGESVKFAAMVRATSVTRNTDGCRIEAEMDFLSLGDGEMVELDDGMRPSISLDENDHERLDIEEDCRTGDLLHLIGTVQVQECSENDFGGRSLRLQITHADVRDETTEGDKLKDQ
jgi:hypothetical protein